MANKNYYDFYNWYKKIYLKDVDIDKKDIKSKDDCFDHLVENLYDNNGFDKLNYLIEEYTFYMIEQHNIFFRGDN